MNAQPHDFEDLKNRLLKLERQNRRFKQLSIAVLIFPALLLVMGQAATKKTVEADEFILRDDGGNIRARLFMTAKATTTMSFPGMTTPMPVTFNPKATLAFYDEKGQTKATLDDGNVTFFNSEGTLGGQLGSLILTLAGDGSGSVVSPYAIGVFDEQGFEATLGTRALVTPRTGETHKTSAASLILLDKDKNVIWKAP